MSKIPHNRKMYCSDFAPPTPPQAPLRWVLVPTEAILEQRMHAIYEDRIRQLEREKESLKKELEREIQCLNAKIEMLYEMIKHDRIRVDQLDKKTTELDDRIQLLEFDTSLFVSQSPDIWSSESF